MRWVYGFLAAGALLMVERPVSAQVLNSFGGYPAGITTGSSYGFYPGGFAQTYTTYRTPLGVVGAPATTYYSSGFYGGVPGSAIYGTGVNFSSPNAAFYGYGAPITPYGYAAPYGVTTTRRGLLGRRTYTTFYP